MAACAVVRHISESLLAKLNLLGSPQILNLWGELNVHKLVCSRGEHSRVWALSV